MKATLEEFSQPHRAETFSMSSFNVLRRHQLHIMHPLAERRGCTVAPALRDGPRHWVGEDVFLAFFDSIEDASRDRLRRKLGYIEVPCHVGVHGAGENGMNGHAASGPKGAQRLRQRE